MKRFLALCLFLIVAASGLPAEAGTISMQTSTTCTGTGQGVRVEVSAINIGDEPAANVRITACFGDNTKSSLVKPELEPGWPFTARLLIHPELSVPGAYPVEVRVDFHDMNGHPYSALSYSSFVYKQGADCQVFAEPTEVTLEGRGRLTLNLTNTGRDPQRVQIRLIAPMELSATPASRTIDIKARGKRKVSFDLENFAARGGAGYTVLAFIEYEADGLHHTSVSQSRVCVLHTRNFFKRHQAALIIAAAGLILAVVLIQVFRPKDRGAEA